MTEIFTAPPVSATVQQLLPSSAWARAIVLAPLRFDAPADVRRLSALVMRLVTGTSYVALSLYRLEPHGAQARDVSNLDLTVRRWRRCDASTAAVPLTAVAAGSPVHVDRDLPRALQLDPARTDYYVAMQVSDADALPLCAPAETLQSGSRALLAGILTLEIPTAMGTFPDTLRWGGAYVPMPLVTAYDAAGAFARSVGSL